MDGTRIHTDEHKAKSVPIRVHPCPIIKGGCGVEGKHSELTGQIIGAFYDVYNSLGYGFLEKVHENALAIELRRRGLTVEMQKQIQVFYRQQLVGDYFADMVVAELVVVEIKAAKTIASQYEAQLLNYLKATHYEVGLLLNFGPKPGHRRKVYDNELKSNLESDRTRINTDKHR